MEPRPPTLNQHIQVPRTRNLPWRDISDLASAASREIPEDKIPVAYLAGLNEKDRVLCLRASLICLEVTGWSADSTRNATSCCCCRSNWW